MSATLIDGRAIAASILDDVAARVAARVAAGGDRPHLAAVLAEEDAPSLVYVRGKRRACERVGMTSSEHLMPAGTPTSRMVELVGELNSDPRVSGLLVQLPVPRGVDPEEVIEAVDPAKDVDGFHPFNAGRLCLGRPAVVPCTPAGIIEMLDRSGVEIEGRRAVVVGRSNIVGKPLAQLLLARNATVTVCHSRTPELASACRQADILVVAAGRPGLVGAAMVKAGAAVVDVGMNRVGGRLAGDVDPDVGQVAGHLTPVPGGVGPMTVAFLMRNTLAAEERRHPVEGVR
ncbi:MAG: bifunctional 5,10-methylenetetrahydrofolate dehydrogenase/5,10-methenyltetrahydrofolate cyclohydrolase [Candidatus Dormibacterales bacterium]